jgi:hypothetical protein
MLLNCCRERAAWHEGLNIWNAWSNGEDLSNSVTHKYEPQFQGRPGGHVACGLGDQDFFDVGLYEFCVRG